VRWLIRLISVFFTGYLGYRYSLKGEFTELAASASFFLVFLGTFTNIGKQKKDVNEKINVSQSGGHFSKNDQTVNIGSSSEEK